MSSSEHERKIQPPGETTRNKEFKSA